MIELSRLMQSLGSPLNVCCSSFLGLLKSKTKKTNTKYSVWWISKSNCWNYCSQSCPLSWSTSYRYQGYVGRKCSYHNTDSKALLTNTWMAFVNTEDINVAAIWSIWPRCLRDRCRNKQQGCRVIAINIKWTDYMPYAVESWERRFGFMYKVAIFCLQFQVEMEFCSYIWQIELSSFYSEIVLIQTLNLMTTVGIVTRDEAEWILVVH